MPIEIPTDLSSHNIPAKYATNSTVWFDVWPAVEHFVPREKGGSNAHDNLVCCSWRRNDSKGDILFEDMGWKLGEGRDLADWDGLTSWFKAMLERQTELIADPMVKNWTIFFNFSKVF